MRKKLLLSCLVTSLFATLSISESGVKVSAKDSANGYHIEEVIRDKFNKEEVDSTWKLEGSTLNHYYNAFHCMSPVGYGMGPLFNAATLSKNTRYEFTLCPQSVQGGANISFNIGMPGYFQSQSEPNVDCKIQLWDTQVSYVDYQNNLALPANPTTDNLKPYSVNLYEADTDVAVVIENVSSELTNVYVEFSRNGKVVSSNQNSPFKLYNPRYINGYCGFFWDCLEMDMTNFRVYNDGVLTYADEGNSEDENSLFTSSDISYSSADADTTHLLVYGLNATNCYFASVNSILMNSGNAFIQNSYELVEQENVSQPYEIDCNLKINELNDNSFVGFGLGLDDKASKIDAKNAVGFIKADDENAKVVAIKNGTVDESNGYLVNLSKLSIGKNQNYSVVVDHDNHAYLTFNGLTYKFDNIDYKGQFALGLVDLNSTKASNFELKEISLNVNSYKNYSSEDRTNDFKGTEKTADGLDSPYLNDQKYFVGPQVTIDEDWSTGETSILFSGSGSYSAFGTKEKYSEFICEFDFEVLSRSNFQYIGLAYGKESFVDVLSPSSASNKAFLFRCDNNGGSTQQCLWGNGNLFSNNTDNQLSPINIFDPENTKYHIMFVAKNRSLYVYYKDINAPLSDLGILRAYIPNINIDGYVSIVGTSGSSFQVTNYKMINLSDACNKESAVTLRESFDNKNTISDKLSISDSSIKNGRLIMDNSSVQTTNQYLYNIIRFTTYQVDENLQVIFSQGKKLRIDALNNRIIVYEDETKTIYDCKEANLKNIKGKRFEITIIGDQIKVGYKGYYDPSDKMSAELISHTFATPLSFDNVTLAANGKVVLDDLYLFALDNSMKCESFDYEDDPDDVNIWEIKKDYDPSKVYKQEESKDNKGCNGSASGLSLILLAALPLLIRRKEGA